MVWFVVGPIAGAGIRFASKKLAQNFVKKAGGRITQTLGKTKQSIGATTKKFKETWKSIKKANKQSEDPVTKGDMIAGGTIIGPGSGLLLHTKSKDKKKEKQKEKRLGLNRGKK